MGKRKDKDGPTAPKKARKVSNIPPLPWTAERAKLVLVVGNPRDAAVSDEKGNWPFGG